MLSYKKKLRNSFKSLTFYWKKTSAGRNSSGRITAFHRGGGVKRKQRRIDFQRFITNKGQVIRMEYDPCRTAWIALIQWFIEPAPAASVIAGIPSSGTTALPTWHTRLPAGPASEKNNVTISVPIKYLPGETSPTHLAADAPGTRMIRRFFFFTNVPCFSYVLAWHSLKIGEIVNNAAHSVIAPVDHKILSTRYKDLNVLNTMFLSNNIDSKYYNQIVMNAVHCDTPYLTNNLIYKNGNSLFLCNIPVGTRVHNIELAPQKRKGAQLCRAAGTFAELVEKMENKCLIRLPSGKEQYLDSQCRATIGIVSNLEHELKTFYKAGQNRWHGKRPIVRGVAMNPIDHPHGGGEGRTKGGRPSVSPWGKPCKSGFKTVLRKKKILH